VSDTGWVALASMLAPFVVIVLVALVRGYHFSVKAWRPITRHTEVEDAEPKDHTE
jgi:uncharacterized membrane protein